jgi:hypothetical protein
VDNTRKKLVLIASHAKHIRRANDKGHKMEKSSQSIPGFILDEMTHSQNKP